MSRPVGILLVPLVLIILHPCNAFTWKCPEKSQWLLRSDYKCKDKAYLCLFDTEHYKEICRKGEEIGREGFTYILTPNPDQVPCAASQYQPFTFTTDGNSQCVLSKSSCKSSGQVLANNGTSSTDTSCRCDYRRNYDYVIPPKDHCSCKPAEEDCSCYIRKCEDDEVMIADYRCLKNVETILPEDIKCPIINRNIPSEEANTVYKKQFQPVSGSVTWSKQASVILIVIVIIYTVLIGFLFFSVPNVTSILLESKLELSLKRKENEFMISKGDNVTIKCSVRSYIPIRSVTWQKEIDDEIVQITSYEDKYKMDFEKMPSLTIDNFNAGDQGKYRCIVRNAVGLRNEMFGSSMNYFTRFSWLTGFVSMLKHIPAFHTEDITLHNYDIDSQSKQTVYNVYKGDDITIELEQHVDDQHKLIAVKWFKESDKGTELDLSNKQYSGGLPDFPYLTIKATTVENTGKYYCMMIYDNGETQKALFKLKLVPQVTIYKAVLKHREDKTFIRTTICDTIDKHLQQNNLVVICGREGTGKSKISLELASFYEEKDYMVFKVDLSQNYTIYIDMIDTLLIIDDQQYTQDSLKAFMKHLLPVLGKRNIKVILTCRNLDLEILKRVPEINELKDEAFIDINNCLTPKEKEKMISRYLEVIKIATSPSHDSKLSVQVKLDENAIRIIKNEEPWTGFPLTLSLFFSDRNCLHLGAKFFTNPPAFLLEKLIFLYETARKESNQANCIHTINEYCVLVYIMKNSNHQLDLNDPNLCRKLVELYQILFHFKYTPDKPGSNEDQKIAIEEAVHRMNNIYLKFQEGVYEFIHPCLLKAMFLSSESMVPYLLEFGSLYDITELVRSKDYTALENELVIEIDEKYHHTLCERLVRHAFENRDFLLHVSQYIYSYWRLSDNYLVNEMFRYIEFILFKTFEVHIGDHLSLDNESLSESNINLQDSVKFSTVTVIVDELTFNGRDPWIYGPGSADFLIISALVSAAKNRYATNRVQTFKVLLEEFQNRKHLESFVKLWSKPLDIYANTLFHYLMGLSQKEASAVLSVHAEMKYTLDTENVKKYTPLDIAAFLGKIDNFKVLNLKTSNCTYKLRKRLTKLAKCGQIEYYNKNSKDKIKDQLMIHKTKDGSVSPEILECEGDDNDKKEVIDENKKDRGVFKRENSLRKEDHNKREEHDRKDVLCFEDFMNNIVDHGEIEDYQSIITLLSKKLVYYGLVKKHTS